MIVIILGVQGLIMGVLEIVSGFRGGGFGSFILGAINLLVGLLLLSSPVAAAFAVPIVFGVLLLDSGFWAHFSGISRSAMRGRRQKVEGRRQKAEDRRQKTEFRRQKTERQTPNPELCSPSR